tara:strand:- start:346 stop:1260 length:915 start_codon:yes stop_codon:yes gene_type:complete
MDFFYFILGSLGIFFGSTLLIDNSTLIARTLRISPVVIGLTIIAFGTSLPELVVSVMASIKSEGEIVLGNVVGSNIANIFLVLPVIVLFKSIPIKIDSIKQGLIYLVISTAFLCILLVYQLLNLISGLILLSLFCIYMFRQFKEGNRIEKGDDSSIEEFSFKYITYIVIGIILLGFGSDLFINSSIAIAIFFDIPKIVISVSLVAFGTSVPELVTSIVAIRRNEPNFVIGNILGSNIINILLVLGTSLAINDIYLNFNSIYVPYLFLIISGFLLSLVLLFQNMISKIHGFIFLLLYALFIYLTL